MAQKSRLIILFLLLLTACGSDELTLEERKEADMRMADTTIRDFGPDSQSHESRSRIDKINDQIDEDELKDHPLREFLTIRDIKIVDYFGRLDHYCDPEAPHRKSRCDKAVQEAVKKSRAAGFNVSEKDFYNRSFQLKLLTVRKEERLHNLSAFDHLSGAEFSRVVNAYNDKAKQRLEDFKQGRLHDQSTD